MSTFDLETFVANPTLEVFERCRKDDLLQIGEHYRIPVVRQSLKRLIKDEVLKHLIKHKILNLPDADGDKAGAEAVEHSPDNLVDAEKETGEYAEVETEAKTGLPPFHPFSPTSIESGGDARLKVRLARMQIEAQERAETRHAEMKLRLDIRKLEIDAETQVKLRQLELDSMKVGSGRSVQLNPVSPATNDNSASVLSDVSSSAFDISKHIALVPHFRESEVDSYFAVFERVAAALHWPKEVWCLLLQCRLVGKAQEVCSALTLEESLKYDSVKSAVLRAYELVPEAYRQRFRNQKKNAQQTFVEFARDKGVLFDKWLAANNVRDFNALRELMLLEDFKNCLPERIVTYLNEQKVTTLSQAATLADEYVLTHKSVFSVPRPDKTLSSFTAQNSARPKSSSPTNKEIRECFYCHKIGHLISECLVLKRKNQQGQMKPAAFVKTLSELDSSENEIDAGFKPFLMKGLISVNGNTEEQKEIKILRDTGALHSFLISDALPLSDQTYCGSNILVQGIEMGVLTVPLHQIHLQCDLISGFVKVGVRPSFPVKGVAFILGNDLAGDKVSSLPEVVDKPDCFIPADDISNTFPDVFSANVVTRAQKRRIGEEIILSDSFLPPLFTENPASVDFKSFKGAEKETRSDNTPPTDASECDLLTEPISHERIKNAQRDDESLTKCFSAADKDFKQTKNNLSVYVIENGLLLRKWRPSRDVENEWEVVCQIVLPTIYREQVLNLAHDHPLSGHLGVTKTYKRILKHFFWPGLKKDVVSHCRTCHVCQVTGKPNQKIPPAPLVPIPIVGEPFEHVILDCVGPLPKTKAGNQFLLTIMCSATRFPEAIPLRKITAPVVIKAMIKFFSTFGLPKIVQTDQGTNFLSKVFTQVLTSLGIKHRTSSAYHPESQGAIERFHQTLKSMLRKYCMSSEKDWDEGIPLMLFAIRESTQESLGFSPADLTFGHVFRGPLKVLKDGMLNEKSKGVNILDFVSRFRERLHNVCTLARESLSVAQEDMKGWYDRKAVVRDIKPGDDVLVLLPVPGSALSARFSGPYKVSKKLSETDFVINTPDRKRKFRTCHINMLKLYYPRKVSGNLEKEQLAAVSSDPLVAAVTAVCDSADVSELPSLGECHNDDDDFTFRNDLTMCGRLLNSEILDNLPDYFNTLSETQRRDLIKLLREYPMLFSDVPTQTNVLQHDIQVTCDHPIKQHAYRINNVKRSVMKDEVDYLLKNNLAEYSHSPWSSPCLLVPKADGTFRFCTDYRKVNSVTVPDSYPLPRMEDCIDNLGSAKFVTKLDLLKGFWQIPLSPRAAQISAFVTPDNFLQYKVMAFGLRNAPATFQRLVNIVLSGVPNCHAYLDDLVIYSCDWDEHLSALRTVFKRLSDASLTINLAKCEFGKATITYLGKEVGQGQVRPVSAKVTAIAEFPIPTTRRELRRFLGMAGYYRSFCRNFSTVVCPLTSLLSPKADFVWSDACQQAFESIKLLLTCAPVLAAPDFSRPFKIEVDASSLGAGAVLVQEDDVGFDHPICYFSRKFNRHQRNYSTIEKEALALILALQFFEVYVGSSVLPVTVYTDHNPLVFLSRMYNHNQRLMRWSLIVQNFNLNIKHKKGSENVIADTLSRA